MSQGGTSLVRVGSFLIMLALLTMLIVTPTAKAQTNICTHYDSNGLGVTTFNLPEYDPGWVEVTTSDFTICHPQSVSQDIPRVKSILERAHTIIEDLGYRIKNAHPVIYLSGELLPNFGAAPWVSTNYSAGNQVWMVYLAPSHPEWIGWGGGVMRASIDDYHIRVLSGEYFEMLHDIRVPAPRWVHQGFSWYNELVHFLDWEDNAPRVAELVNNDPDHAVFLTIGRDGIKSFGTDSVYVGGSAILTYLEFRFEGILEDMIKHPYSSFDIAMNNLIERRGSTVEDEYYGLLDWAERCHRKQDCEITPFNPPIPTPTPTPIPTPTPTPVPTPTPTPTPKPLTEDDRQRKAYYANFTPPLPGPLSYWDWLIYKAMERLG